MTTSPEPTFAHDVSSFVERYYRRLQLDPTLLDDNPTLNKLQIIHEKHLQEIPFENLSQHGAASIATLDVSQTAIKVLDNKRGGFCYELNTLLGAFLTALGYQVQYVPSFVCDPLEDVFEEPTHVILLVTCCDNNDNSTYYADVGLGEPPLHPLAFGEEWWDVEQVTPEGMISKLHRDGSTDQEVILSWKIYSETAGDDVWEPRLRWNYHRVNKTAATSLQELSSGLQAVTSPKSIFSQKIILTKCTRTQKHTLAGGGSRLKITGPPRFFHGPQQNQHINNQETLVKVSPLVTREDTLRALEEVFGIPREAMESIALDASVQAPEEIFDAY